MQTKRLCGAAVLLLSVLLIATSPLVAEEEEKELGWFDTAEFSLSMTSGNAEAESLALRNSLRRVWEDSVFTLSASALRAETAMISRIAVGSEQDFVVRETSDSEPTAENYSLSGRYDREVNERLFWHAGVGWERNEFAGIKNRMMVIAGVGNVWFDDEKAHFSTDYGVTYTDQEDVVENTDVDDAFFGLRFSWDYERVLTATTTYGNLLVLDANVEESSDYRANMVNSLAVAMSDRIALKMSHQVLFDNDPALAEVPLMSPVEPGIVGTVLAPLEEIDTSLTASLVVDF